MLNLLRRLTPRGAKRQYHRVLAMLAMVLYRRPSRKMVVVGVTGTDGKTTTAAMIAHVLASAGRRVGLSSSALYRINGKTWPNDSHMTMPGRFALQRWLRRMVDAGCQYAVLEVSSEGLAQYRHLGVDFDVAVLTNLTPEHIQAHGSFEKYRHAKELLFGQIIKGGDKHLDGKTVPRVSVVNLDDQNAPRFLSFWAEKKYGVTLGAAVHLDEKAREKLTILSGHNIDTDAHQSSVVVDGQTLTVPLPGRYNVSNALEAAAVCLALGLSWAEISAGLKTFSGVPGRVQAIPTGHDWRVVVDYALTPNALEQLYESLQQSGVKRILAVFGAAGGGRDVWKRPELGKIADRHATKIFLTTDDPYSEDPTTIAQAIQAGISDQSKVEIIVDRAEAIRAALTAARTGDVIAITGMGSETSMIVRGKKVPWNDAQTVERLLHDSTLHLS